MKTILKNENGVSIVQVMVAFGLMSVLGLAVMRMNETNMKESKRVELKGEIDNLHREVLSYMSNDTSCTNTFGGVGANLNSLKTSGLMVISAIKNANNTDKFTNSFFRMGVGINDISVDSYNTAEDTATMKISYTYKFGKKLMTRVRPFTINFEYDDINTDVLKRCLARGGVTNIDPKQICDLVVGFTPGGASYFDGATCDFPRASCEKTGGLWNDTTNLCDLSDAQKLVARQEACNAKGGFLTKVTKAWHYKLSGHLDDTIACTNNDMDPGECYCKTKYSKYYGNDSVSGSFPYEKTVPLARNQQSGGYFTIQEHFPAEVGQNVTGISDKKRFTKLTVKMVLQYLLPDSEYTPPTVAGSPWMLEPLSTPFILVNSNVHCYSSNTISASGNPSEWELRPSLGSSSWGWSQGGSSYSNSFSRLGGYGFGSFGAASDFRSKKQQVRRLYAAQKQAGGYIDWRNQYEIIAETYAHLEPGDKCIAVVKPVYSSDHTKSSFNIRFSSIKVLVDQHTNLMDIPLSDG